MLSTLIVTEILELWIFEDLKGIQKGNPFFGYKGLDGLCHTLRLSMLCLVSSLKGDSACFYILSTSLDVNHNFVHLPFVPVRLVQWISPENGAL